MIKPALILAALLLGVMWVFLRSEYDFTTHVVQGCAQPITVVQYTKPLSGRGVAFVLGKYTTSAIPQDCLTFARESGFDALAFQAVITCENGTVVVYHDKPPLSPRSVPGMKAQQVNDQAYPKPQNRERIDANGRTVITLY